MAIIQQLLNYNVKSIVIDKEFENQGEETLTIILKEYEFLAKIINPTQYIGPDIVIGYPTDKRFGAECSWNGKIRIIPDMAGYYLHEYFHYMDHRSLRYEQYTAMAEKLKATKTMQDFFAAYPKADGRTRAGKHRNYFSADKEVLARFFNDFVILNYGDIAEIPGYQFEFDKQEILHHSEAFRKMLCRFRLYVNGVPEDLQLCKTS